jgi:hypothetical protein
MRNSFSSVSSRAGKGWLKSICPVLPGYNKQTGTKDFLKPGADFPSYRLMQIQDLGAELTARRISPQLSLWPVCRPMRTLDLGAGLTVRRISLRIQLSD